MTTPPQLRPYQIDLVAKIYEAWESAYRVCVQASTGAGKTVIFCQIIRDFRATNPDLPVLVVAHRRELIMQCHRKLGEFGVSSYPLIGGIPKNLSYPVQVASIQTWVSLRQKPEAGLVVLDECHRACGSSYQALLQHYPEALVLGATATPQRLDGKGLDSCFESLVCGPSTSTLIEEGFLVPIEAYTCYTPNLKGVKTTAGDYNERQSFELMNTAVVLGNIVQSWQELACDRQTIVFAVTVEHSISIAERYRAAGVTAEHIDGTTPTIQRDAIFRRFAEGKTRILCNVGIATEGTDIPGIEVVQFCRPTKSLTLWFQSIGRGMRPAPGKEKLILLDHGGCVNELGLPTDPIKWTLQGKELGAFPEAEVRRSLSLGQEDAERQLEVVEDTSVKLQKVDTSSYGFIDRLRDLQQSTGRKPKWAFYRLVEQLGTDLTRDHLDYMRKLFDFKRGWTRYAWEEAQELLKEDQSA